MKESLFIALLVALPYVAAAQTADPTLTAWIQNTTGETGYGGLETNVQKVQYSDSYVYISCTCIPGYDIGPWKGNPNTPKNQNFVFQIPRAPKANTGTLTPTPLGHIGVWSNGVSIFNAKDAHSYNNAGVWNQNAIAVEGASFDECLGHPAPNGEYHHHLNPVCLYNDKDSTHHSPIIGYAFDGFPIYGAYGYANADGTGGVQRMRSSYRMRDITERTTLPDGTALTQSQYGPAVSTQYPLGYYIEDFAYVKGLGDLDENNGRFCVTPEYPHGTYAYFVTIDSTGTAAYPYTFGPNYYGIVNTADVGPQSGHVSIAESVLQYLPTAGGVASQTGRESFGVYPNPASYYSYAEYASTSDYPTSLDVIDARGVTVFTSGMIGPVFALPLERLSIGSYRVIVHTSSGQQHEASLLRR